MKKTKKTKISYIKEFFKNNPGKEFKLNKIEDIIKRKYEKDNGNRDIYTNRGVRDLPKRGFDPEMNGYVERTRTGHYKFVEGIKPSTKKSPFSDSTKKKIKERDDYKCQMCGVPENLNQILAVDHVIPEDGGGIGEYDNGITLCTQCNNIKKNLNGTTFGKKMFEKYLQIMKKTDDETTIDFLEEVLKVYEEYDKN